MEGNRGHLNLLLVYFVSYTLTSLCNGFEAAYTHSKIFLIKKILPFWEAQNRRERQKTNKAVLRSHVFIISELIFD